MLIEIPAVLKPDELAAFRQALDQAEWQDGRGSAGYLSQQVKRNQQLPDNHPLARQLGEQVLRVLESNERFVAAALPDKILPPLFNSYQGGEHYGPHIDGAIRPVSGTPHRIRTDLSATLFLSAPETYQGGELCIEDELGRREIKLPAGSMLLYPATTVHSVRPVSEGRRLAAFFWIQSMVREDHKRALLFKLDRAIQQVASGAEPQHNATELAGVYHNLLRLWANV